MKPDTKFKFGEWLPDLPDLDNPGLLEALNVLSYSGAYIPYIPYNGTGSTITGLVAASGFRSGNYLVTGPPISSASNVYIASYDGTSSYLQGGTTLSSLSNLTGPTLVEDPCWCMCQLNNYIIAASINNNPQFTTTGITLVAFAKLTGTYGDAPKAKVVGVFNQFVILGNLPSLGTNYLRWSGINAPLDWPTPGSAQAIAEQSGEQYLDSSLGDIEGIANGDQWAVVMCQAGVVRVTYLGGQTVFQFDTIYRGITLVGPNAWVKVGPLIYMMGRGALLVTDGTSVQSIGYGKVEQWLSSTADWNYTNGFSCAYDPLTKNIRWTFSASNSGICNTWLAYNVVEKRFTHGADAIQQFVRQDDSLIAIGNVLEMIGVDRHTGNFTGTIGNARITTAESEFFPGKRAIVTAVTPEITGTTSVSVKIGSRTKQSASVVFTASVTPDPFTGDSNFYVDDRYHRAQIDITGNFTQATGGTFDAQTSSAF